MSFCDLEARLVDQVGSDRTVNDGQYLAHRLRLASQQETQRIGETQYPLTHRSVWQDMIHQKRGCLHHASGTRFFQERATMLEYFRRTRAALKNDGLLFFDVFGGSECYQTQKEKRKVDGFKYIWEQAEFNANY